MRDTMSLQEAADELGWTPDDLFVRMVADGMVLDHPEGGYVVSPHPDMVRLSEVERIIHEPWLYAAEERGGLLSLVASTLVDDAEAELAEVFRRSLGRELIRDTTERSAIYLAKARTRVWR